MTPRIADIVIGGALALPWIVVPIVSAWRAADSRSLDEEPDTPPPDAPLVSVIIPARDEAANIERCVRSVLGASWPALDVLVVDDHSRDGTGDVVRRLALAEPRLRLVEAPPLPAGWYGKPWACSTGARAARGAILCFADADTVHAPDLATRAVNAMRSRQAGMLSVAGTQELGSFWEIILQPQVFAMLSMRYGGTEVVNRSPRAYDKIANGQCIFVTRTAYDAVGGHESVRDQVAEDLMLAQRLFAAGERTALVLGLQQLSTRMYTSLGEVVAGWRKNIFAGGAGALPPIAIARWLFPLLLASFPLLQLLPAATLLAAITAGAPSGTRTVAWAAVASLATLVSWVAVYRRIRRPLGYALGFPLGAAVLLWIILGAIARGRRVSWKGREYQASRS